jgi:hypothetical protein
LAKIIEKASGQTLKTFAYENIFEPLGMKNTLFYDDNTDLIKNRVFSYEKTNTGFKNLIFRFDLVGSGGVYSNIEDLYLWDQNFFRNKLGNGDQSIIQKMQKEGSLNNEESSGYAYALSIGEYNGLKTVSHGGGLAGYRTQLLRFPDQNFSIILLANRSDAYVTGLCYKIADIFLEDIYIDESDEDCDIVSRSIISEEGSAYSLDQIVGNYEYQPGIVSQISVINDSLYVYQSWNGSNYPIVHTTGNTYEIPGNSSIQFVFSDPENDLIQKLTVYQNGNEFISKRKEERDLSAISLEDYKGKFYNDELDATYSLYIEDGILKLQIANYYSKDLYISDLDVFYTMDDYVVSFIRSNGELIGFNLDAEGLKNFKFNKK